MLSNFTRLAPLIFFCMSLFAATDDPVIIQVGHMQQTRSEFEQQFETAMVLNAINAGVPIKSGLQIRDLKEHYLEQRVAEMLLLQQAQMRGISVSDTDMDNAVSDFMLSLADQYSAAQRSEFSKDLQIRSYLREQLILRRTRQVLIEEGIRNKTKVISDTEFIVKLLKQYRQQSAVEILPELLE